MKGIWIPKELLEMDISWTKRALLSEISQLEMLESGCIASNAHFSDKLKLSKQAISKALNELDTDGLIVINNAQTKRNFGRTITINFSKSPINFSKSGIHESGESKGREQLNNNIYAKAKAKQIDRLATIDKKDLYAYMQEHIKEKGINPVEIEKFTDYFIGKGEAKKDWKATFRNWCRSEWVKKSSNDAISAKERFLNE